MSLEVGAGPRRGEEQETLGCRSQYLHLGLDVALAVEQQGVKAFPRLNRLDVIGHLALEELGCIGATQRDDEHLGFEQATLLPDLAVTGIEIR